MLSFRGGQHVALADPVLLRTRAAQPWSATPSATATTAVCWSAAGRVPAACACRSGTVASASPNRPYRIFDEFYQVHSARPLEAHQRKGLGLGLAIVKRLCELMQAPSACARARAMVRCSRCNCRRARPHAPPTASAAGKAPLGLTLQDRLILVVEDEAAVREGLVVLLQAWGASVVSFETVEQPTRLATPAAEPPDLLLVDYRLPEAHRHRGAAGRPGALAAAHAAGHRHHRQQPGRPRGPGRDRARLPPPDQARAAEQAARGDPRSAAMREAIAIRT